MHLETSSRPLIVNFAPTGMVPTRQMSPYVPLQPGEIVADVLRAAEMGITVAHLHARDEHGEPTTRKEVFARIVGGIRERRPDLVLCVTCSGRNASRPEDRAEALDLDGDLRPDMGSLTLSSLNFPRQASVNAPDTITFLAKRMAERGILPEIEVFDIGMANAVEYLQRRGLAPAPAYANLLFGNLYSAQADLLDIAAVVNRLPAGTIWSLAGLGAAQLPVAAVAAAFAPAVRIGLEDNLWLDAGRTQLATNAALIERVHAMAAAVGREVMAPSAFRERLGMQRPPVPAGERQASATPVPGVLTEIEAATGIMTGSPS